VRLGADLNRVRHQVIQLVHVATGERPVRLASGESLRLRGPAERWNAELQVTLARLAERVDAIERHLGIAGAAGPGAPAREAEHPDKLEPPGEPEPAGKPEPVGEAKPAEDSPAASDLPDAPADPPTSPGGTVAAEEG